jgi:hypothetical protein
MYAITDPQWGDPKVIPETIAETEAEAKYLALTLKKHSLWSGADTGSVPPQPGKWENLHRQGYRAVKIRIEIESN